MDHPLDRARARLQGRKCRIVFPEGDDPRIREAAGTMTASFPELSAVLIGGDTTVGNGHRHPRLTFVAPDGEQDADQLADLYIRNRPGTAPAVARRFLRKPMYRAGLMLKAGLADCMVAGISCPTARVIEASMLTVGLQDGVAVPSSFFMMLVPGRAPVMFADCAVNIAPTPQELAAIGMASARSWKALMGTEPRTAFLSFSTHGSASHAAASAVKDAAELAGRLCPAFSFEGELQADAALNPRIAALKVKARGSVSGQANVLVFPNLDAANIGYKLLQELAGATALGPVLQGFARPVSDLSRGASVQDIVDTALMTAGMALGA